MSNANLATRYFSCVKNRDLDGLCALYSSDAELVLPDGRELFGVAAIREMYSGLFASQAPSPTPVHIVADVDAVAAELEIRLPNGDIRRTANFFSLDSTGLIKRLSIYARK
ncbi:MAG: nuclear transport factor 2 family protein [Spongiibacteraceae bacterium]